MDKYKGQGHTRSRSPKHRKAYKIQLHVSRHTCRFFRKKVTKVKVKVTWLLKIEAILFD